MASGIKISIPTPCHEGWESMSPNNRGRFCASCQKTVVDFTNMTDREIARLLQQSTSVCGHVRRSQLNRPLIIPTRTNTVKTAAGAAVVSLIALTGTEAHAQTEVKADSTFVMKGVVRDANETIPGINITNKNTGETASTDIDGAYSITVHKGDNIAFSFIGYEDAKMTASQEVANVEMQPSQEVLEGFIIVEKKRTFFGRIFHSIGNIFR